MAINFVGLSLLFEYNIWVVNVAICSEFLHEWYILNFKDTTWHCARGSHMDCSGASVLNNMHMASVVIHM